MIEEMDASCPPFYISLNIHDKILHNCLLELGASHNLMPKVVMDELGLSITKPYHDLFSFDSRKVKFLGPIKDLVINLSQLPSKSMDLTYATIPMFGGETKRLYRENQFTYIISNAKKFVNHPIYVVDTNFGACIL